MNSIVYYHKRIICVLKILLAKIIVIACGRKLIQQNVWLFEEKHTEARDNAYHLYVYIKKYHPEIHSFYVIEKGSADESKICEYGSTIHAETIKHYIYWIACKYSISSQPYGSAPYPREWSRKFKSICRKDQKVVFLQHGITYNNVSGLDHSLTGFDLFTCAAIPELSYVREGLHYSPEHAKLLGLCRFDRLNQCQTKKIILIMPTFRKWLISKNIDSDATEKEMERFKESEFYKRYFELLTNKALLQTAEKNGYKIVFYLHYSLQAYTKAFIDCGNNTVLIADRYHYDVQQLLMDSALLVTDFSSIFFDFAYMGKPEAYYQFDEEKFRGKHYQKGYFDYRRDGFGPVLNQSDELIKHLINRIENGCSNEKEYMDRIQAFFPYRDSKNCERTYNAIIHIT